MSDPDRDSEKKSDPDPGKKTGSETLKKNEVDPDPRGKKSPKCAHKVQKHEEEKQFKTFY